jgi:transposase-like protein
LSQHFLLSARARSLSLRDVLRMDDKEAWATFCAIRWSASGGQPFCPHCGSLTFYDVTRSNRPHPRFRCKDCGRDYSPTTKTLFAYHKLSVGTYLAAIALFVNAVKGVSALQMGRDLNVSYKSAFVMLHKIREAMAREAFNAGKIGGEGKIVEIDGCFVGGHVRPENLATDRVNRRAQYRKLRRAVVVMRERGGRSITQTFDNERQSVDFIRRYVNTGTTIYSDFSPDWRSLGYDFTLKTVNHQVGYSVKGISTNQAESFFSRLRRAEWGQYHHISGIYLARYAAEMAWKEDHRRKSTGDLFRMAAECVASVDRSHAFTGYWQRHTR